MREDGAMVWIRRSVWLAPVLGLGLALLVYRDAHAVEDGLYSGAEPSLAGMLVAAPYVLVSFGQTACAMGMSTAKTSRRRTAWAVAALSVTGMSLFAAVVLIAT